MVNYRIFDITFDPSNDIGLTAISFVDFPAICQDFIYQSSDNKEKYVSGQLLMANAEKHEVISPILIPNQLILRVSETGEKYYMRWSKETIEKIADYYLMNQFQNNFTFQHSWFDSMDGNYEDSFIKDVYMKRMWIIDDAKTDEANKVYGYHLPEGTLMVHLKIHNRNLWKKIKSGEVKGLSVEAFTGMQENGIINYKKQNKTKMNKLQIKDLFDKFMLWYSQVSDDAKELADVATGDETESGEVSLKYYTSDTDYIEIATDGTATASDGSTVQDGEYALADGNILVIVDGKFSETKPMEQSDEAEPVEAPVAEAQEDDETEDKKEDETPEDAPADSTDEDEKKDDEEEQKMEEVDAPYTLVEIEINGETYNVPQEVYDYIRSLEENASMAETFKKELVKYRSETPSIKPVGNVVKESKESESTSIASADTLIASLNRKLK